MSARGRTSKCCTQTNKQTDRKTKRHTERSNILAKMFFRQVMNSNGAVWSNWVHICYVWGTGFKMTYFWIKCVKVKFKVTDLFIFGPRRSRNRWEIELKCNLESCSAIFQLHFKTNSMSLAFIVSEIHLACQNVYLGVHRPWL